MGIKCTEITESQRRNLTIVYMDIWQSRPRTSRTWQMRKRSLTSLGWRYHL